MKLLPTLVAVLALAAPASARVPLDPVPQQSSGPVWVDSYRANDDPAPVEGCPSIPVSQDPVAGCPDEPSVSDDDGNPVPCNYDSGMASDPCPHATEAFWIARCENGDIIHVDRDAPEGEDYAEQGCGGPYTVIDR